VLTITRTQLRSLDAAAPDTVRLDAVLDHLGRAHPEVLDGLTVHQARALTEQYVADARAAGLVGTPSLAAYAALCFAFDEDWPRRTRLGQFLPRAEDDRFLHLLGDPPEEFIRRLEDAYPAIEDDLSDAA
jgi:hypothetical protein